MQFRIPHNPPPTTLDIIQETCLQSSIKSILHNAAQSQMLITSWTDHKMNNNNWDLQKIFQKDIVFGLRGKLIFYLEWLRWFGGMWTSRRSHWGISTVNTKYKTVDTRREEWLTSSRCLQLERFSDKTQPQVDNWRFQWSFRWGIPLLLPMDPLDII